MKEVEVSGTFKSEPHRIRERLSPESIVEYEGTFRVESSEETVDGLLLTVVNDQIERNPKMTLEFSETQSGYKYRQIDKGLFDAMYTEISITEDPQTRVTVRSHFTFGGIFAFIKDWFAVAPRRQELELLLLNLANDLGETGSKTD